MNPNPTANFRIPVMTPELLLARLARIALARQSTVVRGVLTGYGREAFGLFADEQEKKLKLAPIAEDEIERYLQKVPGYAPKKIFSAGSGKVPAAV